jgi:CheY-like chemotaxis protein
MADASQIHQVVMNLCTNAYHAMMDQGGLLTIGLTEVEFKPGDILPGLHLDPGRFLKLDIQDTGHGMEPGVKEKIFEPYFTTKDRGKGTGLGLAVVFGIVQEHKGVIHVESEPGKGSLFQVYFPIAEKAAELDGTRKEKRVLAGRERILLVDDEIDILDTMQAILAHQGYAVTPFDNGETALSTFIQAPDQFDLIITDMTMPGITGDKLSREVLKIRKDIPIILCTGYCETFSEADARKAGILRYVQKPVTGIELSKIIRDLMD